MENKTEAIKVFTVWGLGLQGVEGATTVLVLCASSGRADRFVQDVSGYVLGDAPWSNNSQEAGLAPVPMHCKTRTANLTLQRN